MLCWVVSVSVRNQDVAPCNLAGDVTLAQELLRVVRELLVVNDREVLSVVVQEFVKLHLLLVGEVGALVVDDDGHEELAHVVFDSVVVAHDTVSLRE